MLILLESLRLTQVSSIQKQKKIGNEKPDRSCGIAVMSVVKGKPHKKNSLNIEVRL